MCTQKLHSNYGKNTVAFEITLSLKQFQKRKLSMFMGYCAAERLDVCSTRRQEQSDSIAMNMISIKYPIFEKRQCKILNRRYRLLV